jgi:hypothetical protein
MVLHGCARIVESLALCSIHDNTVKLLVLFHTAFWAVSVVTSICATLSS